MTDLTKNIISEIKSETKSTQRMLEGLEDAHLSWKPHEKSMSTGALANHIVQLHNWVAVGLTADELDLITVNLANNSSSAAGLRSSLSENLEKNIVAIQSFTEENWAKSWTLKAGDRVIATMPKAAAFRYLVHNHLIHHRGQLSVYLRMQDLSVPGMYGPSADER